MSDEDEPRASGSAISISIGHRGGASRASLFLNQHFIREREQIPTGRYANDYPKLPRGYKTPTLDPDLRDRNATARLKGDLGPYQKGVMGDAVFLGALPAFSPLPSHPPCLAGERMPPHVDSLLHMYWHCSSISL